MTERRRSPRTGAKVGEAKRTDGLSPGKRTLASGGIHRNAVGTVQTETPAAAFANATSGLATSVPFRGEMETAFSHDFSTVQAHLDRPDDMAALGASAAARGEHVAFADASPDKALVAHELTHVVQARNAGGTSGGDSVSSPGSASELEADRAADRVASGGNVEVTGRADAAIHGDWFDKSDEDGVDPGDEDFDFDTDASRETDTDTDTEPDTEPETAADRAVKEVNAATTTSWTDWAVTDDDAITSINTLNQLPAADRSAALDRIDLLTLVENSAPSDALWKLLRSISEPQFNARGLPGIDRLFQAAFGLNVTNTVGLGGITEVPELWNLWHALLSLPPGAVPQETLTEITMRTDKGATAGSYAKDAARGKWDWTRVGSIDIGIAKGDIDTMTTSKTGALAMTGPDGTVSQVNAFDRAVRHEIGHAVDQKLGGSKALTPQVNAGRWINYDENFDGALADMAKGVSYTGDLAELKRLMFQPTALTELGAASSDRAFRSLCDALAVANSSTPYTAPNGGVALGGRIYQNYSNVWSSYDEHARSLPCSVSEYQFASPLEWFAEMYAAYYQPNSDGSCDHKYVRDAVIRSWFDGHDPASGVPTPATPGAGTTPPTTTPGSP